MPPRRKPKKAASKASKDKNGKHKAKASIVNLHQGLVNTFGWLWKKGRPVKRLAEEPAVHPLPRVVRIDVMPGVEFKDKPEVISDETRGTKDEVFSCQAPPDMTIGELRVAFRDWMGRVQGFGLPPPPDPEGEAKEGEGDAAAAGAATGDKKADKKAAKEAAKEAKKKKKEAAKEEKSKKSGKKEKKTKELKPPTPMNFTSGRLVHYGCTKPCYTLSTTYPNYLV